MVELTINSKRAHEGWLYPSPQQSVIFGEGVATYPFLSRVFGLIKTHQITHTDCQAEDQIHLIIWVLSFFQGIRLSALENACLDASPIEVNKLTDFVVSDGGVESAITTAEMCWHTHQGDPQKISAIGAILHVLFLAKNPQLLEFERFIYLYTALDAVFALSKKLRNAPRGLSHGARIQWICELFDMDVPSWAQKRGNASPLVVEIRNHTLHESIYANKPLGFAVHEDNRSLNLTLEMSALVCRLVVALLGHSHTSYVKSAVNTRQRHLLRLH